MSHDRHAKMTMQGKSCCCKSGSESQSNSCSMHSKHDHHNKNGIPADSKNNSKSMMCNSENNEGCSMKMKDKNVEQPFEKLDENSDGKISISEYLKLPDQKFNSLDANKDGYISRDEINGAKSNPHSHH